MEEVWKVCEKLYFTRLCVQFSSVQLLSCVQLFATPWITARQASLCITNSWSSPKLMFIESVMLSSILCPPLLLLPSIPPSIRVFSNELTLLMRWPKYWSFSLSISPSEEHPGLISFRMDWLDLLAVQGTLKSLLQHHSSKALSINANNYCVFSTLWQQVRTFYPFKNLVICFLSFFLWNYLQISSSSLALFNLYTYHKINQNVGLLWNLNPN